MKVEIIGKTQTSNNLTLIQHLATIANRCYTNLTFSDIIDKIHDGRLNAETLIERLIKSGHMSIFEHVLFTFNIEDISVACLGQLTRHRLASFSVRSLRYNNLAKDEDINVVIPEGLEYRDVNEIYLKSITDSYNNYCKLIEKGYLPEQARYVLPQGIKTSLIMSMNLRELFHFFELRNCNRADKEIHQLAQLMLKELDKESKFLFSFVKRSCNQCTHKCNKFTLK